MNSVEIEEAISALAERPFDPLEFPYQFLEAFGNKETTIKRLRAGATNKSDLGGVLQHNNIHIAVAASGEVTKMLAALKDSPATAKAKAQFVLATDGESFEAEDLDSGETVACAYADFPNHFGFFLQLAGITPVKQIRDSSIDIRATGRLNRLYVELLKDNPEWGTAERRHDMNHFMARLIFCFFAEDTDIFSGSGLFTKTVELMSARDSTNTHEVISDLFCAMNTKIEDRAKKKVARWADAFPYVNGGLFAGDPGVPHFSKIARSYLLHIGNLDWTKINPDIFGSMIQAVADDEERGALGMHYTSRPNILKVLNPLFLDELRAQVEEAGENSRKLLNLRNRMARIRVFDPACGSGNFLVIAYKEIREVEAEVNRRRGEPGRPTVIPLTNFRGIEIRDFAAEVARLALIIAEFQCDVVYRGKQLALAEFLPLKADNWIICGNALRLDWLSICPPTGTGVKLQGDDLFSTPLDQVEIDFSNEGGATYICGNPPYSGQSEMTEREKNDLSIAFVKTGVAWKSLDYVSGWFQKALEFCSAEIETTCAFVATNSICQGQQVSIFWEPTLNSGLKIHFARTSFKWKNLARNNAGVTVVVVGLSFRALRKARLFIENGSEQPFERKVDVIGPYLIPDCTTVVRKAIAPINGLPPMDYGSKPTDGGNLILKRRDELPEDDAIAASLLRQFWGSDEIISGLPRYCLWIEGDDLKRAETSQFVRQRVAAVAQMRAGSRKAATRAWANKPYRFVEIRRPSCDAVLALPSVTSEARQYLTPVLLDRQAVISNLAFGLYDLPLWIVAVLSSRLHLTWITAVCGQLETRIRYSNTLGWNTFPIPILTEKNKGDLTFCAETILLAREARFPAPISDLYDPDAMPADLREAHEHNDEVLERIYIGRRFRNDTERLEKLFDLYTTMIAGPSETKRRTTRVSA